MKRKVRIKALPKARQGGYVNPIPGAHPGYRGAYGPPNSYYPSDTGADESTEVNRTLKATPREHANLEAEKGETVITNLTQGGIPEFYTIGGKRHYDGGTPLNLPADSFIFSRDRKLKIKDKDILAQFGITKPKKGGYTPAEISKKYDINKYRKILADPTSDRYQKETAERMIENYNYKLGALAMIQESMKGFPNGVPAVAVPYLEQNGIDPSQLIPDMFPEQGGQMPMAQYGGTLPTFPTAQHYLDYYHGSIDTFGNPTADPSAARKRITDLGSTEDYFNAVRDHQRFDFNYKKVPGATPEDYSETWSIPQNRTPIISKGRPHKPIKFFHSTAGDTIPFSSKEEVVMPTFEPGGPKIDYTSKTARDSMAITPGTQNINPNILTPRDTLLTKQYEWSKDYTPTYDPTNPKKMDISDTLHTRKEELNAELLDIRRGMAKTYGLPTTKQGLPDYEQIDPDIILDKSQMDPAQLQRMYDIMYEKRAIRDAQGFQRKQFYGDLESEQKGYSAETPLEDLNLGIRFATGVQSQQLKELKDKDKDAQLASLSLKKYGGDAGGKKKVRVKLPSYDVGGVATSNRPTRWQNVPKNETRWDITKPGFDETKVRKGHYIKKADGKWYKATGKTPRELPTYKGENLERTFSNDQAVANKYAFLEQTFNDRDIKEEFAAKVKEALKNEANYKDKTGKSVSKDKRMTEEEINALTPDDIVQSHLNMQRRNYAFVAKGIDPKDFSDSNGELKTNLSAEKKKKYKDLGITNISTAADVVGVPLGEQGADSKIGLEQASYIGFNDLLKNRENYSSELQDKLKPFKQAKQWGSKDEPLGTISPIDRWYTDTSAGQLDLIDDEGDMGFEEAEWKEAAATDTKHLADPRYPGKTPFWTQDSVNFGQAVMNRYNIPRFEPYEAKAQVRLPRATFMDPMQQVQNILGSQSNVLDAASTYATPGGFAATAGLLHGQSANAAANAIANVHNQNVQIANQFELRRNDILNRASERDAQLATRLHDKYNILNQQLANSKKQASAEIWKHGNNAWTNRGITHTMNEATDQYKADPITGFTYMGPGRDLMAKDVSSKDISKVANDLMGSIPGLDAKDALAAAQKQLGYSPTKGTGVDPQQFMYPGGMGYGYFPQG